MKAKEPLSIFECDGFSVHKEPDGYHIYIYKASYVDRVGQFVSGVIEGVVFVGNSEKTIHLHMEFAK
jgi:hypothetical protein